MVYRNKLSNYSSHSSIQLFYYLLILVTIIPSYVTSSFIISSSPSSTKRMYTTSSRLVRISTATTASHGSRSGHTSLDKIINHLNNKCCCYSTRLFSTRKERKEVAKSLGKYSKELDWEHYEFSQNPKNDHRFNKADYASGQEIFNIEKETKEDKETAQKLQKQNKAFLTLSPKTVQDAIQTIEPYINEERLERVRTVLSQRTKNCKFLFENPNNPSNVWACLRTIDSFGIQDVDVIIESGMYQGKQALSTKRGMRTAMGSAQWLTLQNHGSTAEAIKQIRDVEGYKVYASDLNPNSKDVRDINWDNGPYCIVMGNEDRGISEEMRQLADETFTLPMCGFAESFNLSVATSITLAHMSAKSQNGNGPLIPGDLDEHEFNCLYLKGLLHSLPQRRTGQALLKQNKLFDVLEAFKVL